MTENTTEYAAGWSAYVAKQTPQANPEKPNTFGHKMWLAGYSDAELATEMHDVQGEAEEDLLTTQSTLSN